jgi:hypothetical protein
MLRRFAGVLLLGMCLAGLAQREAKPDAAAAQKVELERFEKLTLERTMCEGHCPMYRIVIYGDGTVEYEGQRFVRTIGSAKAMLSREQVRRLVTAINDADYFSLRGSYRRRQDGCPTYVIDEPSVITSVTSNGMTKKVHHDQGCREVSKEGTLGATYPRQLTELEIRIDEIVDTALWVGPRR